MSFDASLLPFELKKFTYFVYEKLITLTVTYLVVLKVVFLADTFMIIICNMSRTFLAGDLSNPIFAQLFCWYHFSHGSDGLKQFRARTECRVLTS